MREETNVRRLERFMRELGRRVGGPGRIYLTGGATAVWHGWRETTIDVDIKADPEPAGLFEGIAELKEEMRINVELAAPDQFIPELPNWRDRSIPICREGKIEYYHYDLYSQALSKLERAHGRDLADAEAMRRAGLVEPDRLWEYFLAIEPHLIRYPAIEPSAFRKSVAGFCGKLPP